MKTVVTGSSGRIGRSICRVASECGVVSGIDVSPSSTTQIVADILDKDVLRSAFEGVDCVFHTAAYHSPHVGIRSDAEFQRTNVDGTRAVLDIAKEIGVPFVVITSTTALYGCANQTDNRATWVTEETIPKPRTIYHRTKLECEVLAEDYASNSLGISLMRMSRCFPEPSDVMAVYRLHRGVDVRDVAMAHLKSWTSAMTQFSRYIVSGFTPFQPDDCDELFFDAESVIRRRSPDVYNAFIERGWQLPRCIDRVYDPSLATRQLGFAPEYGPEEVFAQFDRRSLEVLGPAAPRDPTRE